MSSSVRRDKQFKSKRITHRNRLENRNYRKKIENRLLQQYVLKNQTVDKTSREYEIIMNNDYIDSKRLKMIRTLKIVQCIIVKAEYSASEEA